MAFRKASGNPFAIAQSTTNLGHAYQTLDPVKLQHLLKEGLRSYRELGIKPGVADALNYLSMLMVQLGESGPTRLYALESLEISLEIGGSSGILESMVCFAFLAHHAENFQFAARLLGVISALSEEKAFKHSPWEQEFFANTSAKASNSR